MGIVFFISGFACYTTSLIQGYQAQAKAIDLNGIDFTTSRSFNINTIIVVSVLTFIYITFA
jgi:SSS family solute:Na+ symporter